LGYNTVWVMEQFTASIFKLIYLYLFNIPIYAPILYTLKSTKFTLKHLKLASACFGPIFKTIFRGLVGSTLCSY
jgi:hypothetical protein